MWDRSPALVLLLIASCSASHELSSDGGRDAIVTVDSGMGPDSAVVDSGEARPDASPVDAGVVDATVVVDAGGTDDAGREDWVPLTDEEVACLGLDSPLCAGCHLRDDTFFLLPGDAPAPPPGMSTDRTPEECGIDR